MVFVSGFFIALVLLVLCVFPGGALADVPKSWEMWFQEPATDLMTMINDSSTAVMWAMFVIVVLVCLLLMYVLIRFRRRPERDGKVSSVSHNLVLEVVWTLVPTIIVGVFTYYNVRLIAYQNEIPKDVVLTVKAIGHQWYWEYDYPDYKGVRFDSYLKKDEELGAGEHRLLEVDNRVVVPVGVNVRLQTSAGDVIHSWAIPSFGVKIDAVPGRLNEAWFNINKPGVYYGQCSELCGVLHGYMPIVVEAVPRDKFELWIRKRVSAG